MNEKLFEAIQAGDVERVRGLVAADRTAAAARDEQGVSAVRRARYRMQDDLVDTLLAANPQMDLFDAAVLGRADRVAELLDGDPDLVQAPSGDGATALHLAAFFGSAETVRLLLERGADAGAVAEGFNGVQPLHSAVASRRQETVEAILEHGCDVNATQRGGYTALQGAAHAGHAAMIDLLLEHGADAAARNDEGKSAADLAREVGREAIAERLAALGG